MKKAVTLIILSLLPWPLVTLGLYKLQGMWWTFFLYHWILLVPVGLYRRDLWLGHVKAVTPKYMIVVAAVAGCMSTLGYFFQDITCGLMINQDYSSAALDSVGFSTQVLPLLGVYFVLVNPVVEEIFWRGVVLNLALELKGQLRNATIAWSVIAFGAWHYLVLRYLLQSPWSELAVFAIIAAGALFTVIYIKTRSLTASVLVHSLVFDLPIIVLLCSLVL